MTEKHLSTLTQERNVESKAFRHFASIGALFFLSTALIQTLILTTSASANPKWVYWLSWSPVIVGFAAMVLAIKWWVLMKAKNHG